jgi:hypothetical protein
MLPSVPDPVRIIKVFYGDLRLIPHVVERLDALAFEPTRSHRKALYRFNRLIIDGDNDTTGEGEGLDSGDVNQNVEGGTNDQYVVFTLIRRWT